MCRLHLRPSRRTYRFHLPHLETQCLGKRRCQLDRYPCESLHCYHRRKHSRINCDYCMIPGRESHCNNSNMFPHLRPNIDPPCKRCMLSHLRPNTDRLRMPRILSIAPFRRRPDQTKQRSHLPAPCTCPGSALRSGNNLPHTQESMPDPSPRLLCTCLLQHSKGDWSLRCMRPQCCSRRQSIQHCIGTCSFPSYHRSCRHY